MRFSPAKSFAAQALALIILFASIAIMTPRPLFADVFDGTDPVADERATVHAGNARFTVLTPHIIRLEWSPTNHFEDRASFAFINRRMPVPEFTTGAEGDDLTIETAALRLRYTPQNHGFTADNLTIEVKDVGDGSSVTWTPGTEDRGNLRGTTRTLDMVSGSIPLEPGLVSRDGWVLVDDTERLLFSDEENRWAERRFEHNATDWYFFGHGRDYANALREYTELAGRVPMPPKFVFGSWWSRYWAYTEDEFRDLVAQYNEHATPLDVLVIDMDWHKEGWTGYSWDPRYFPDPAKFLDWARKDENLRITLNLHPHDGVRPHEDVFEDFARAMGKDPEKVDHIPFDAADPLYMKNYFELLHHPLEKMGVDFWWIDWQQGEETRIPGLDPLFWLNHLHWQDMADRVEERSGERPLVFSRWGGLGNHRYQIGFSGDTFCNWESLAFQPYFTATASNVGFDYWSHDIGGHQPGPVDPELYARWIQWGIFSPVLRTHTTKNPDAERRIWAFDEEFFEAARDAFYQRYNLIPYIYTAARRTFDDATPMVRPLYWEWPEIDEAYRHGGEVLFGDQMLVAPVVRARNEISGVAEMSVWLPPGEWVYEPTGRVYEGPTTANIMVPLDTIPVFMRSGAVVPMAPRAMRTDARPLDPLILDVFPGESGGGALYEDDGVTADYAEANHSWTKFTLETNDAGRRVLTIHPPEGEFDGMLTERSYRVRFREEFPPAVVTLNGQKLEPAEEPGDPGWVYQLRALSMVVVTPTLPVGEPVVIEVEPFIVAQGEWQEHGLRERLDLVRQFRVDFGEAAPLRLGAIDTVSRKIMDRDPGAPGAVSVLLSGTSWGELANEIAASKAPKELVLRSLLRMLGMRTSLDISGATNDDGKVEVVFATSVEADVPDLSMEVELELPPTWRTDGEAAWTFDALTPGETYEGRTQMDFGGTPQAGYVTANVTLHSGDREFDFTFSESLFPSINGWWIIGPFHNPFEDGLALEHKPEQEIDLDATYEGKNDAEVGWQKIARELDAGDSVFDEFYVDFLQLFDYHVEHGAAYALCWLEVDEAKKGVLALGSDDGVAVWLNGEQVYVNEIGRPYTSRQDRVPLQLQAGRNELMLKVNQGGGAWGFAAHLENADGQPLEGVVVSLDAK